MKHFCLIVLCALTMSCSKTADIRVGSYNIRMSGMDKASADNNWDVRKERLWKSIEDCCFDVFGLQEVSSESQTDLKDRFGKSYGMYFFSPYSQDGVGDKAQGIMYRNDVFTITDIHNFWIGPDPHMMSSSDVGKTGHAYNRGGFCCILTHKKSGLKLFFMNMHGCLNEEAKVQYAKVFEQMEILYNKEGHPSVFVGDFNVRPDHQLYEIIAGYWKDSFLTANVREGVENTFNAWKHPEGERRIDFILYRGNAEPLLYCCDNTLYDGLYPSDHFPLYTDFRIGR